MWYPSHYDTQQMFNYPHQVMYPASYQPQQYPPPFQPPYPQEVPQTAVPGPQPSEPREEPQPALLNTVEEAIVPNPSDSFIAVEAIPEKPKRRRGSSIWCRVCVILFVFALLGGGLFGALGYAFGLFNNGCNPFPFRRTISYKFDPENINRITLNISNANIVFVDSENSTDTFVRVKVEILGNEDDDLHRVDTRLFYSKTSIRFMLNETKPADDCQKVTIYFTLPQHGDFSRWNIRISSNKSEVALVKLASKFNSLQYESTIGGITMEKFFVQDFIHVKLGGGSVNMKSVMAKNAIDVYVGVGDLEAKNMYAPTFNLTGKEVEATISSSSRCNMMNIDLERAKVAIVLHAQSFHGSFDLRGTLTNTCCGDPIVLETNSPRHKQGYINSKEGQSVIVAAQAGYVTLSAQE